MMARQKCQIAIRPTPHQLGLGSSLGAMYSQSKVEVKYLAVCISVWTNCGTRSLDASRDEARIDWC
jgi:hypothetical protein